MTVQSSHAASNKTKKAIIVVILIYISPDINVLQAECIYILKSVCLNLYLKQLKLNNIFF
jgi:hypothetical protein